MRGALIHGVLLAVMLVYGYRTWTRDKTVQVDHGAVVLWDKTADDLVSIELKSDKKDVVITRKGAGADAYWWGSETTITRTPKPKPPTAGSGSDTGSGSGSGSAAVADAGSGSGSGSGSAAVEMDETRKTKEFPAGEPVDKLVTALTAARAMRDLGAPSDDQKKEFKLVDAKTTLIVTFKDGAHTFLVGGSPFGGGDRYVVDQASGKAYVVSKDMITSLETGETSLHMVDPRGYDATKIDQVTIEAGGKTKDMLRIQTGVEGQQVKTWGDAETKKADQTIANFIDNANNLRPTEYQANLDVASLTPVVKLSFRDDKGKPLGYIQLLKHDKPAEPMPGKPIDPANPPKPVTEYFLMSEKTRVPALLRKETAERTEQDVTTVFSDHPLELPPKAPPGHGPGFKPGQGPLPPVPTAPVTPGAPVTPHTEAPAGTPITLPRPATPAPAPGSPVMPPGHP